MSELLQEGERESTCGRLIIEDVLKVRRLGDKTKFFMWSTGLNFSETSHVGRQSHLSPAEVH